MLEQAALMTDESVLGPLDLDNAISPGQRADGVSPAMAADRLAEERIASGGPRPWLPPRG